MSITTLKSALAWLHGHTGHWPSTVRGLMGSAADGAVICAATLWLTQREHRRQAVLPPAPGA